MNEMNKLSEKRRNKVLLAEDNALVEELIVMMLKERDCDVVVARNGEDAVRLFDASFDLVLLDYQMPKMKGDEAARRIREKEQEPEYKKQHAKNHHLFMACLTAHPSREVVQACINAGIDDILFKPVDPDILSKIIERAHK